jgi:hypothetical protein
MTEHSVLCLLNSKEIWVANASLGAGAMWDAPYQPWTQFTFDELFVSGGRAPKL